MTDPNVPRDHEIDVNGCAMRGTAVPVDFVPSDSRDLLI